ncbi:hypothetical protein M409DRAFT_60404 [Zasmidium cellare ATCC 36951]|uniref:Ysc84 actin-binding domain-containing protein n=1 Tax=Zasmidium cellare ATCC 36951 TaxID=1080233 RepID=A0A6A6BYY2_ZASCE|nr:uncharacterized protein M409DRAFT_60404 [Zasmidium cellare ATCC 36951]KAF2160004.1 hypothetical protein M409DRAFT_60404 [Zasmidium cellare ATCC 36951]
MAAAKPMYQPGGYDNSYPPYPETSNYYAGPSNNYPEPSNSYPEPSHYVGQQSQQEQLPPAEKQGKAQKFNRIMNKMSKPLNKAATKMGCEAFNPQELDLEMEKCARILRSFCIDGFMAPDPNNPNDPNADKNSTTSSASSKKKGPHGRERKALYKIPPKAIQNCKGLAIFTCMRFGLHIGGGNGCGVLIRHLPDGSWSAPSGIHMASMTGGLVAGLDVYDCVAVINTDKGMEGFTRVRGTIGGEVAATVGPLGAGAVGDLEVSKRVSPVWTYTKNRGLYVGAHIDGTIFIERTNENPRFYGKPGIRHAEILSGEIIAPQCCNVLYQTLNAIEGKMYNPADLPPPYEAAVKN